MADAYTNYKVYFEDKKTGYYEKDNVLYFIAEVERTNKKLKKIHYEGKAMLLVNNLIKDYLSESINLDFNEFGFNGKLKDDLEFYFKNNKFINISNLKTRVLINRANGKIYRYVIAVSKDELAIKQKTITSNNENIQFYLTDFFKNAKKSKKLETLISYYKELGLIEDSIIYQKSLLSKEINLVNYFRNTDPYKEREVLRKVINGDRNLNLLEVLPANKEIMNDLIIKYKNDSISYLTLLFTSLVNTDNLNLIKKEDINLPMKNLNEYLDLIKLLESSNDKVLNSSRILKLSKKTLGHLNIDKSLSSKENSYFVSARDYFNKGIKPKEIISLLSKSIEVSPNHSDSWAYLGAILMSQNKIKEALIIYNQAYQINSENIETMAGIADCYHRLGFNSLANSYAKYLVILNRDLNSKYVNKIIKKIKKENNV